MIIYTLSAWNKLPSFLDQGIDRVSIETVTNDIGRDTYSPTRISLKHLF